jgi:hypothetical protein
MTDKKLIKILLERIDILEEKINMSLCKGCTPYSPDGGVYAACPIHGNAKFLYDDLEKRKQKLNERLK